MEIYLELPLQFDGIRFKPSALYNSIAMNVATIISTPKGSAPCELEFGATQLSPDKPLAELGGIKDDLARTVKDAIEKNEPRLDKVNVKVQGGLKADKSGLAPLKVEIMAEITATGRAFKLEKVLTEDYYRAPFPGRVG
jgi:predicted component of type VI protein secretion system